MRQKKHSNDTRAPEQRPIVLLGTDAACFARRHLFTSFQTPFVADVASILVWHDHAGW